VAQDLGRGYEDLGNAARKIWLDLGARIRFPVSPLLEATGGTSPADRLPPASGVPSGNRPRIAVGEKRTSKIRPGP
jgi:hypothetical protein